MAQPNAVTPFEVAVLVLHYLDASGHKKTAGEARLLLGDAATALPAGVKSLQELLNDYVGIRERDGRRQQLLRGNPVAQSLYSLLDFHAGLPTPQHLPPIFYAAAAPPLEVPSDPHAQQQQQQQQQQQHHDGAAQQHGQAQTHPQAGPPSMLIPVQRADLTYLQPVPGQGQQPLEPQQQQGQGNHQGLSQPQDQPAGQHTPRRQAGHRKAAPRKRRKLEGSLERSPGGWRSPNAHGQQQQQHVLPIMSDAAGIAVGSELQAGDQIVAAAAAALGSGGMRGGALDLLNMQLDEEGLTSLLCDDDLQNRFASGLAQHITTVINQPPAHNTSGTDGTTQSSEDHWCIASIEDVLAELPADPEMAQLLQQFVRAEAGPAPPAAPVGVGRPQGAGTWVNPGVGGSSGSAGRLPATSPASEGGLPPTPPPPRAEGPLCQGLESRPGPETLGRRQQHPQQPVSAHLAEQQVQHSGQAQHSGEAGQQAQQVARPTAAAAPQVSRGQQAAPSRGCVPAVEPAAVAVAQPGTAEPSSDPKPSEQGQEPSHDMHSPAAASSLLDRHGQLAGGVSLAPASNDPGLQLSGIGDDSEGGPQARDTMTGPGAMGVPQPGDAAEQPPDGIMAPAEPPLTERQQQEQSQEQVRKQPQSAGDPGSSDSAETAEAFHHVSFQLQAHPSLPQPSAGQGSFIREPLLPVQAREASPAGQGPSHPVPKGTVLPGRQRQLPEGSEHIEGPQREPELLQLQEQRRQQLDVSLDLTEQAALACQVADLKAVDGLDALLEEFDF
ncbi:hypothetical protein N2152v2_003619 [Parachlorella kessleri]